MTEPDFCRKFIFAKIWTKRAKKIGHFGLFWKSCLWFSRKQCKMKIILILDFPSQTPYLAKFLFWSYYPKCSWPIRLQDCLKCIYLPKKLRLQVYAFVDKHQSFLQYGTIVYSGHGQACPKVPKKTSLQNLYDNSDDHQRFL